MNKKEMYLLNKLIEAKKEIAIARKKELKELKDGLDAMKQEALLSGKLEAYYDISNLLTTLSGFKEE